jgi:hypothetical protein
MYLMPLISCSMVVENTGSGNGVYKEKD